MEALGIDVFHCQGLDYLIMVDRYSGYPMLACLNRLDTASIIAILEKLFTEYGVAKLITSDGARQFTGAPFKEFCKKWSIRHEISSAYSPQSNGLAEAGVKNLKNLLLKFKGGLKNSDFRISLLHWRNTPRQDRLSPAEMFFKRKVRTLLPELTIRNIYSHNNAADKKVDSTKNCRKTPYEKLPKGQLVRVFNPVSNLWADIGHVLETRDTGVSYLVKVKGKTLLRNRRFLKPIYPTLLLLKGEDKKAGNTSKSLKFDEKDDVICNKEKNAYSNNIFENNLKVKSSNFSDEKEKETTQNDAKNFSISESENYENHKKCENSLFTNDPQTKTRRSPRLAEKAKNGILPHQALNKKRVRFSDSVQCYFFSKSKSSFIFTFNPSIYPPKNTYSHPK